MNNYQHFNNNPSHNSRKKSFFSQTLKGVVDISLYSYKLVKKLRKLPLPNYIRMNTITTMNLSQKREFLKLRFLVPLLSIIILFLPDIAEAQFTREYSSYWGGSERDDHFGSVLDDSGNAFYFGYSEGGNFPVTAGAYQSTFGGVRDGVVTMVNPSGAVVWSTYLGGSDTDKGWHYDFSGQPKFIFGNRLRK